MRRKGELSTAGIDRGWPHQDRFGGAKFDPAERGRGANWATWKKG
jgi:hypothetical protein